MHILKRTAPLALALVGVALLVAGCGASSPTTTSTTTAGSGGPPKNGIQTAYKFSECMRNHGVTNFPDPVVHQSGNSTSIGIQVNPSETSSPAFKTAQKDCAGILPMPSAAQQAAQQRQQTQDMLSFAHCLRSNGVNDFPDPDAQGRLTLQMIQAAGIDLHAPSVISAADKCVPASHGAITLGDVAQATGAGGAQSSGSGGSAQPSAPSGGGTQSSGSGQ
jgi:hypothetical protein